MICPHGGGSPGCGPVDECPFCHPERYDENLKLIPPAGTGEPAGVEQRPSIGWLPDRSRIYVASKSKHAPIWRWWRAAGVNIVSTWIDEADQGETGDWADLWDRCIQEAASADYLVAYHETTVHPDGTAVPDEWKGAFVEIGAHLAHGGLVLYVGEPPGSWKEHRRVRQVTSLGEAFGKLTGPHRGT